AEDAEDLLVVARLDADAVVAHVQGHKSWVVGRGSWVVGRGSWVGPRGRGRVPGGVVRLLFAVRSTIPDPRSTIHVLRPAALDAPDAHLRPGALVVLQAVAHQVGQQLDDAVGVAGDRRQRAVDAQHRLLALQQVGQVAADLLHGVGQVER